MVRGRSRVDKWVRTILVSGTALSMGLMLVGLAMHALFPDHPDVDLSLQEIASGIVAGNPVAIIDLGMVILIATPLTRVVTALAVFTIDRELRLMAACILILLIVGSAVLIC